ncbi:MAG: fibronectin type III domain-containing protein [Thermoplasmatota archaeon]
MRKFKCASYHALLVIAFVLISSLPSPSVSQGASSSPSRSGDLLCKYDFKEGEGQYTQDASGMGNHAVLGISTDPDKYDPEWGNGIHDPALRFDGVDDHLNCGNGSALQIGSDSFTVESWIHVRENLTDGLGGILNKYDRTSDTGFFLDILTDSRYGGSGDSYGQVMFGMNRGYRNDSWNVAAGHYGNSYTLYDMVVYNDGLFAATSQGDLIEWTRNGWVQRASAYKSTSITSLAVYDGKIFGALAGSSELVRWDGSYWNSVSQQFYDEEVISLEVYNGMLYAGTSPSGMLLEWNRFGAWTQAASQYSYETGVNELCVFNGELYGVTSPTGYLVQWNGRTSWAMKAQHGTGFSTLTVYRGRLFSADSALFEWNGVNTWMPKTSVIPSGMVTSLVVFGGRLLAGTNGGVLYEWNGNDAWVQRAPISGSESMIHSMCAFKGKLYAVTGGYGHLLEWNCGFSVTSDTGLYPGWNHIVAVRDSEAGHLHIYINGELEGTSGPFDPGLFDLNCTTNLMVGQGNQDTFNGLIDRVRIFGRPLGEAEILDDFDFFSMEWRAPLPPTSPDIGSGDLFVNLSWGPPVSLGTHVLEGYRIYRGIAIDNITLYNETTPTVQWFNDTDLSYGVTYHYLVTAYSEAGESLSEDLMEATPKGRPTPPVNLTVRSGDRFVNISWKPPLMNKGSNITGYRIERGLDLNTFFDLMQLGPEKRYYNDTVVDNRQTYYYRIFARNIMGESLPSNNVSAVPKKLPPPVNSLEYTPCDRGADLTWKRSPDPYFHHFNLYRGTRDLISGGLMGRYYNEPDLTNLSFENQDYVIDFDWGENPPIPRMEDNNFSVRWDGYLKASYTGSYTIMIKTDGGVRLWVDNIPVINVWKDGWHESLSASVYLLEGEHQIKIEYYNTKGRAAIKLSWEPPEMEAHTIPTSNLFGYYITYELIQTTPENRFKDEGLQIGRYYYYHVRAVNDAGESAVGNILEVYPVGLPGEPRNLAVTPGDGYINLTWETPAELMGSRIREYKIFRANGTDNVRFYANISGDQLHFNDTDVVNGLDYFYYVTAVNDAGESEPSASLKGIPIGKPTPPRTPKAELYEGGVRITWAVPKFTGGADLVGYNVYRAVNSGNRSFLYWENDFMIQGYIDIDVSGGNNYTYWITALNEVGESGFSENVSIFIPAPVVVDDDDDDDIVEPVKRDRGFPWAFVIFGVIALVVAALVAAFLIVRYRRRSDQSLMIGPVAADTGMPLTPAGIDDTFDIFHPAEQPSQISQAYEEVYTSEMPPEIPDQQPRYYDQQDQYYPQQEYPQDQQQDQYQQQAYDQQQQPYYPQDPQQYYPEQQPRNYDQQEQYYPQQEYPQDYQQDQYQQQGYDHPGQQYYSGDRQEFYPRQEDQKDEYMDPSGQGYSDQEQPPAQEEQPRGPINEFFAAPPPEQLIREEVQEVGGEPRLPQYGEDEEPLE